MLSNILKGRKGKKGFTLVELIVVVGILLVLSVLAIVAYSNIQLSARKAALNADASALARQLNVYNSLAANPINSTASLTAKYSTGTGTYTLNTSLASKDLVTMDLTVSMPTKHAELCNINIGTAVNNNPGVASILAYAPASGWTVVQEAIDILTNTQFQ